MDNHIATIGFEKDSETKDIEALETIINQRWHYETELDLSEGVIRVYRVE